MGSFFSALVEWVTSIVRAMGYAGIGLLLVAETLFPPIPSEAILPFAGFLVGQGRFSFIWVVTAATAGSIAGALVLYWAGHALGEHRLRRLIQRYGGVRRLSVLSEADFDRARAWFARHGGSAVFLARLMPGLRSVISVPAGVERMPLPRFVLYTAAGSALWNIILVSAGWALGSQWHVIEDYISYVGYAVLALLAAAIARFIYRRVRESQEEAG